MCPLDWVVVSERRLMLVHAHPDDESSQSPATLSRYVDEGAQVTLVTCTLGELGEIQMPELAHYSPAQLGEHRFTEVAEAMQILGVTDHQWLGGRGRYHDSGMTTDEHGNVIPVPEPPESSFWTADLQEAANHLVALLRDRRPQVVATYDPFGNYGHPDHIQAHRVTMYASQLAAIPFHRPDLGEPWQVSRVLWITHNPTAWTRAFERAEEEGLTMFDGWDKETLERRLNLDPSQVAAVIPYTGREEKCFQALAAHRSQVDVDSPLWQAFSFIRTVEGSGEAYRFAAGVPFPEGGPADDLFAGLGV